MNKNITVNHAIKIAEDYIQKNKLSGIIHNDDRSVMYYSQFDGTKGPAWLVLVKITPTVFDVDDEYTIVISVEQGIVKYIIDPNGHPFIPHRSKK